MHCQLTRFTLTWLVALLTRREDTVSAQSNYDQTGNSIEFDPSGGLPQHTVLDGKVTRLDDISSMIFLNRTKAYLNCAAGYMQIELKFEEPFYGIVYADFDRSSACQTLGVGNNTAKIDLPLKGCGTKQDPLRVFTNNIVVRFHPNLEMDGDEVVTIVCRYPPPVAPPPPPPPPLPRIPPAPPIHTPLKGFEVLLIICAVLFMSLVLLGFAASYYCLRNRRVTVVRKQPLSEPPQTESTLGNLSGFEGLKIPRAHPPVSASSSSGSEAALVSTLETFPSDYPSESPSAHSEEESYIGSYDNRAFLEHEVVNTYTEQMKDINEIETVHMRPPPPQPKFDVRMRVKKPPLPSPSPSTSSSDTERSVRLMNVTSTTVQTFEDRTELERLERNRILHRPEIHPAPVYTEVVKAKSPARWSGEQIEKVDVVDTRKPEITSHIVDDVYLRTITEKKTIEDIERHRRQVTEYQTIPPPKWDIVITNYPKTESPHPGDDSPSDWESFSDSSSIYGVPANLHADYRAQNVFRSKMKTPRNWENLTRVLEDHSSEEFREQYRTEYTLTVEDKKKWRKIITTESTLKRMLTEATTREDFEKIRRDSRYVRIFEPPVWEVIIRIISPPDRLYDQQRNITSSNNKYRKKAEFLETRTRRSSLPTLYEYDSDGSSASHVRQKLDPSEARSRRTSRSSYRSDADVRSMSEMTVDFARQDNMSEVSSYYRLGGKYDSDDDDDDDTSMVRSLSQPSLARSASEFTENWGIRDDHESPEGSPRSSVRSRNNTRGYSSATARQTLYQEQKHWYNSDMERG